MSMSKTSRVAKDASTSPQNFNYGFVDESGTGQGPYDPTIVNLDSQGNIIDPATKQQLPASLGQKTSAASVSAVIASDQSAIPTTITGTLPPFANPAEVNINSAGPAALEAGGNLATTATNTGAASTALGTPGDTAATNASSPWSAVALLKGIFTQLGQVVLAAGSAVIGKVGIDQSIAGVSNGVVLNSMCPIPAGQNIYGSPITRAATLTVKPQVTVGTYGQNTIVGGLITFNNAVDPQAAVYAGIIKSIRLKLAVVAKSSFTFYLFNQQPTASVWTDGQPPSIAAADVPFLVGAYPLNNADSSLGTYTLYQLEDVNIHYTIPNSNDILYGIIVANGNQSPTFSTSNDLSISLGIIKY